MFTGIISEIGEVTSVRARSEGLHRIKIACSFDRTSMPDGASIACSGPCLTVVGTGVEDGKTWFAADVAAETLKVTTAARWRHGTRLNLERPLKIGDEIGGHLVSGHVDGVASVLTREDTLDMARITFRAPLRLTRFIATKGSIAIDGVSLTINSVERDTFSVLIIPHTLQATTLGDLVAGSDVNLEVDQMARYAARLIQLSE